jgi:hypothetical protein
LKDRRRILEETLLLEVAGNRDTVPAKRKVGKCLEVGQSMLRNVRREHADIIVEFFLGFETEQLHRVVEKRGLVGPEIVIIHVGKTGLKMRNFDFVMGEVYGLVATAKRKVPKRKLVLSGVLRHLDVSLRHIGARNIRCDWVANSLGLTFVDPNS